MGVEAPRGVVYLVCTRRREEVVIGVGLRAETRCTIEADPGGAEGAGGGVMVLEKGVSLGEEVGTGGALLIGVGQEECDAGAVIHIHMQEVVAAAGPACATADRLAGRVGTTSQAVSPARWDAGQLLDIEVQQFASLGALIAHRALSGSVEVGQAGHPMAAQHAVDGGAWQA